MMFNIQFEKYYIKEFSIGTKVFNIGGIKAVKLKDYITCIEDYLGKKANIDYLPLQLGDVEKTEASTTILYREINFEPSISIDEGILKFIEWYKKDFINISHMEFIDLKRQQKLTKENFESIEEVLSNGQYIQGQKFLN